MAPRLAPLTTGDWADGQLALLKGNLSRADRYLSGDPAGPPIPPILGLLAHHPDVGGPWLAFSSALIESGTISARERELLILRVGHRMGNRYLCAQHESMGKAAGLSTLELDAVDADHDADIWNGVDRHLLRAVDELLEHHVVSDRTWEALRSAYDERQLLEVLFVIGSYVCLAMVLNSVGLEIASQED